jgi:hypothetical protein
VELGGNDVYAYAYTAFEVNRAITRNNTVELRLRRCLGIMLLLLMNDVSLLDLPSCESKLSGSRKHSFVAILKGPGRVLAGSNEVKLGF